MNTLITGGAGYIGSHTAVRLIEEGHKVTIVDNLVNSSPEALNRIEAICGVRPGFYDVDLVDTEKLNAIFKEENIDAVIHFAGLKAVGESVRQPLRYYRNNIDSTLSLLEVMNEYNVRKLVFSSSATVYGDAEVPYSELSLTGVGVTSPYGKTKHIIEEVLRDTAAAESSNEFVALRYFNPVGAHESGLIGEDPSGLPNNLMPFISQVAGGKLSELSIFGDDYETKDGTCVRDYIHVQDLAEGHLVALNKLTPGFDAVNLGSGKGTSVLELVHAFEKANDLTVAYRVSSRREGDLPEFYADTEKALKVYGWSTKRTIEDMCRDTWNWQRKNPGGYGK